MPSNSRKRLRPARPAGSLKCFRYHAIPLYVPRSPPLCEMMVRNESTSLKLCGVEMVAHFESSKAAASASFTSSRKNLQSRLKLTVERSEEHTSELQSLRH